MKTCCGGETRSLHGMGSSEEHKGLLHPEYTTVGPREIRQSQRRDNDSTSNYSGSFRRGSMSMALTPTAAKNINIPVSSSMDNRHVMVDIGSPDFKTLHPQKEKQIVNSLRKNYLNTYMTGSISSSYTERRRPSSVSQAGRLGNVNTGPSVRPKDDSELRTGTPDLSYDPNLSTAGGDITRDIYKVATKAMPTPVKRMQSTDDVMSVASSQRRQSTASSLNVPGGFRREFIVTKKRKEKLLNKSNDNVDSSTTPNNSSPSINEALTDDEEDDKMPFLTKNFLEFLYMYGHFAGESFEDDFYSVDGMPYALDESSHLLSQTTKAKGPPKGTTSTRKVFFLLLKSFIGTGVLFLPNAFNNGGLFFSIFMLAFFGLYSYLCYYLLISSKIAAQVRSFGGIGLKLYGPTMKYLILFSLVITQLGFSSVYVIFTARNLKAIGEHVFKLPNVSITFLMISQLLLFIPLSFVRKISKLSLPSLFANVFILVGLVIVVFFSMKHLFYDLSGSPADGVIFGINNSRWTLFIGTAIFSFEGIGLVIPVQDSMRKPEKFPLVLGLVIICTTVVFITVATIGYLAYGSEVDTVILLNLPQKNILVSLIQLLYSIAIMLSTPLQMFPAIRIIESGLFKQYDRWVNRSAREEHATEHNTSSGKSSWKVKWMKNAVRSSIVILVVAIACVGADNLDKFLSIIGSFACIPLVYMYPPMLHLKSTSLPRSNGKIMSRRVIIDIVLIIFGGISMVYTSYQSIFVTD